MDSLSIIVLIAVVAFALTVFTVLISINFRGFFKHRHIRRMFPKNSKIRDMIYSIKLWELSNKGYVPTKQDEQNEAKEYADFIVSQNYSALKDLLNKE